MELLDQHSSPPPGWKPDPRIEALVAEIIGRVADKWTMLVLETLGEHGELRFTRISDLIPGVSQKMLTKTLRQMERDGLLIRTIHPVIPPRVEYRLTPLGGSLGHAFCGVWVWAEKHYEQIEQSRQSFDKTAEAARAASTR
jgi:DNA-binding HxlR family transcriptional regulator